MGNSIDREKVINDLQDAVNDDWMWQHADFYARTMERAIALLKEREAKQVQLYGTEEWIGLVCGCPDCKAIWMGSKSETHFCPNCGMLVKWE